MGDVVRLITRPERTRERVERFAEAVLSGISERNARILARIIGVPSTTATSESEADQCNPNVKR